MISEASTSMIGNVVIISFLLFSGASTIISLLSLFATRRETEALKQALDSLETKTRATTSNIYEKIGELERGMRGEFKGDIINLRVEISKATEELRAEIREATSGVASLSASVNLLNQSLAAAHARLDSRRG